MTLEEIDIQILVYLNSLGSEFWDPIWIILTNKTTYIPLFAFIVYYIYKRFGLKQTAKFQLIGHCKPVCWSLNQTMYCWGLVGCPTAVVMSARICKLPV